MFQKIKLQQKAIAQKQKMLAWIQTYNQEKTKRLTTNLSNYQQIKEAKLTSETQRNKKLKQKVSQQINKKEFKTNKSLQKLQKFKVHQEQIITNLPIKNFWLFQLRSCLTAPIYLSFWQKLVMIANHNKLLILITLIALFAGMSEPIFFSKQNIMNNILKNNIEIGIMAIGMTFVILTGGIDLSVGSLLGLLGIIVAKATVFDGYSLPLAFLFAALTSIVVGIFHGLLVAKLKLPPFIVTLVGLLSYRGLTRIIAKSQTFVIDNPQMIKLNIGSFWGIPNLVWILIGLCLITMLILKFTRLGKNIYAVGGNEEAAKMSGVKTWKVLVFVYLISALTVMIATISFASRVSSFNPLTGNAYELDVISAVVLGGTSLSGGKGGVGKTVIGWLVISTLSNAMLLIGFSSDFQLVFKGIIILAAVILDQDFNLLPKFKKIINKWF